MLKYIQVKDDVSNLFSDGAAIIIRMCVNVGGVRERELAEQMWQNINNREI